MFDLVDCAGSRSNEQVHARGVALDQEELTDWCLPTSMSTRRKAVVAPTRS